LLDRAHVALAVEEPLSALEGIARRQAGSEGEPAAVVRWRVSGGRGSWRRDAGRCGGLGLRDPRELEAVLLRELLHVEDLVAGTLDGLHGLAEGLLSRRPLSRVLGGL